MKKKRIPLCEGVPLTYEEVIGKMKKDFGDNPVTVTYGNIKRMEGNIEKNKGKKVE